MNKKPIYMQMSSEELRYYAGCAEGYERMMMREENKKHLRKEYKGKKIPVLKNLFRSAEEIALAVANVPRNHHIIYSNLEEGVYYVLRKNKTTGSEYMVVAQLDFESDDVKFGIMSIKPDNLVDLFDSINELTTKSGSYKWKIMSQVNGVIKCHIEWKDEDSALERMVEDNEYIRDLADRLFK